jgi:restriction system protein
VQAVLRKFNISGIDVPTQELSTYLVKKYDNRFDIHPRKLEEIVASIFRNTSYEVELTSYSKDNGIDLFLFRDGANTPTVVQVKRYKRDRRIGVSAIREFLGAMVYNNSPHGIFVTTSTFTQGSLDTTKSEVLRKRGFEIELWDANRLFDALSLIRHDQLPSWQKFWMEEREKERGAIYTNLAGMRRYLVTPDGESIRLYPKK